MNSNKRMTKIYLRNKILPLMTYDTLTDVVNALKDDDTYISYGSVHDYIDPDKTTEIPQSILTIFCRIIDETYNDVIKHEWDVVVEEPISRHTKRKYANANEVIEAIEANAKAWEEKIRPELRKKRELEELRQSYYYRRKRVPSKNTYAPYRYE